MARVLHIEDDPKSRAGRRTVALPSILERSNFRHRVWLPATRAVGMAGLRFHDLRHTAGTLAARTGATTKELMARLGHASPRAALIYQHAADDRDHRIAEALDQMATEAGLDPAVPSMNRDRPPCSGTDLARRPGESFAD